MLRFVAILTFVFGVSCFDTELILAQGPGSGKVCAGCYVYDDPNDCETLEGANETGPCDVITYAKCVTLYDEQNNPYMGCNTLSARRVIDSPLLGTVKLVQTGNPGSDCYEDIGKYCLWDYACDCDATPVENEKCVQAANGEEVAGNLYANYELSGPVCTGL